MRKRLILKTETVRLLAPLDLRRAVGGVLCSDTCHICDPPVGSQAVTCLCTT